MAGAMVRLPRILDASFNERGRVTPIRLEITLETAQTSTASMTVRDTGLDIGMHDWLELYTVNGSAGLFRVTGIERDIKGEAQISLAHGIDTLSDSLWKVQEYDYTGTVDGYLAAMLAQQTRAYWQLGVCEDVSAWKKKGMNYPRLSQLWKEIAEERPGYLFTFDFSTTPWTVNFVRGGEGVASELRLGRNIEKCRISYDDSDMCNRLFMTWSVESTDQTTGYTKITDSVREYNNAASQAVYGVIEKCANVEAADEADPDSWAARYFAERATPIVSISVDGLTLKRITGESWDETRRGEVCRVALPDYGITIEERVMSVRYPDAVSEPERVTVELANRMQRASDSLAKMQEKTSGGGGGGGSDDAAKKAKSYGRASNRNAGVTETQVQEFETQFVQTNEVLALKAWQNDLDNTNQRVAAAEVSVTAHGVTIAAHDTELTDHESRITANEAYIAVVPDRITAAVANKVDKSSVEITADSITVDTKTFTVDAQTVVNKLAGQNIVVGNLTASNFTLGGSAYTGHLIGFTSAGATGTFLGTADLSLHHFHSISFSESGGQITATIGGESDSEGSDSFNIAATATYRNGVAAAEATGAAAGVNGLGVASNNYDASTKLYEVTLTNPTYGLTRTITTSGVVAYNAGHTDGYSEGEAAGLSTGADNAFNNMLVSQSYIGTDHNYAITLTYGNRRKVIYTDTMAYDYGEANVTASVGGWSGGQCAVTLSNGQTATVYMPSSYSSASISCRPNVYSGTVYASVTIGGQTYSFSQSF